MPNTMFIAVQCCQCCIMQVKQQKKSSNKWTCVVCNQKQSVRKVFAQSSMARDLRQFVQSFNMSQSQEPQTGGGFEPRFEIEMPNKKPKLNIYPTTGEEGGRVREEERREHEHASANAATIWNDYLTQDDKEPRTCSVTITKAASNWSNYMTQNVEEPKKTNSASKWRNYMIQDDMVPRTCQPAMTKAASKQSNYATQYEKEPRACQATTKAASKWCDYMTEDEKHMAMVGKAASKWKDYLTQDEHELQPLKGRKFADHMDEWRNGVFETTTHDQEVEDEIHPDFF